MAEFPSDEALRAALDAYRHRRDNSQDSRSSAMATALDAFLAVDEPKIRADERRRIAEELRAEHDRRNGLEASFDEVADYIERLGADRD